VIRRAEISVSVNMLAAINGAVLVCWWLLLPWALVLHWRRWRKTVRGEPEG
jgi:hypothetical protein